MRFDRVLTKLGLLSEDELAAKLAEFLGIQSIGPEALPSPPPDVDGLSVEFLKRRGIVPVSIQSGFLELAVVDPFDSDSIGAVEYLTGLECRLRLMSPATSEVATERLSDGGVDNTTRETPDARFASADGDLRRLEEMANEAPIIKLVNQILAKAVESGASDVHLEPEPAGLVVRMRHDGALATYQVLPPGVRAAVASRVKIMSRLDIAERRLPQDGRMKMPVRGIDVDFRVATLPTMHGEAVVIRVLDGRNVRLGFDALGFDDDATVRIRSAISNPNGLVFVTGPTGSGKTTTLYAALAELNRP
ncbi:MAG: Flp pilus assembly complex ATPase component TadA, partial [Hyphomicrobiales bacterium]|nr:Flp pilus assembly complex ATPase component TadA [Hyphomicrobiales bacterium]